MLRGIFMPAGVPKEVVDYYVELLQEGARDARVEEVHGARRVQHRPSLTGKEYADWVAKAEQEHVKLMKEAGLPRQEVGSQAALRARAIRARPVSRLAEAARSRVRRVNRGKSHE